MTKKGINKKYVALLIETSDKYRKLDVIHFKTVEEEEPAPQVDPEEMRKKRLARFS